MNVVIKVNDEVKQKMIEYYKDKMRDKKIPYVVFQAKDEDTVITMYESGKVMFQGPSADVDAAMWGTFLSNHRPIQPVAAKTLYRISQPVGCARSRGYPSLRSGAVHSRRCRRPGSGASGHGDLCSFAGRGWNGHCIRNQPPDRGYHCKFAGCILC